MSKSKHARGRWDGCGAPAILIGAVVVVVVVVFHKELGSFAGHIIQRIIGR